MSSFDPSISLERIQAQYARVYYAAWPELLAILEYEIRMRGGEPRQPAAPKKAPRRSARA
jgi:hypothetical protein